MTQATGPYARTGWTVTGQRQTQALTGGGQFVPSVEVSFTTGAGVNGMVTVPLTSYTPDAVAAAIDARAAQLDMITGLTAAPTS